MILQQRTYISVAHKMKLIKTGYILKYKNKCLTWKLNFIYKCSPIDKDSIPPPLKYYN